MSPLCISVFLCLLVCTAVTSGCDVRETVTCSSYNGERTECEVADGGPQGIVTLLQVLETHEDATCALGYSYGYLNGHVWVDHGCGAQFHVCSCDNIRVIRCEGNGNQYRPNMCRVPGAMRVSYTQLQRPTSHVPCTYYRYGFRGTSIWVAGQCSGYFDVCYTE